MIDTSAVRNSDLTLLGRIILVILIGAIVFSNYAIFSRFANSDATFMIVFIACQIVAAFMIVFLVAGWFLIALVFNLLYWMVTGESKSLEFFFYPWNLAVFGFKYCFGNWRH